MNQNVRRLVTVQVAAKESGIPKKSLYRFIAEGRIPGVLRVGRKVLISRAVWDRFVDGESINGNSPSPGEQPNGRSGEQ